MKYKTLTGTAVILMMASPLAFASTVETRTITQQIDRENVRQIRFSDFDVNKDGLFSREEVGEKLFDVFDRDSNQVIDNNEWTMRSIYTVVPMQKEVYRYEDINSDGLTDTASYSYETFFVESGLIHFDQHRDGLTPQEFISVGYQSLDDNDDNLIELDEWKEAYMESLRPLNAEPERYNN